MVSSHIRRLFRRRMDLRIRIRTAYALGHPRAPRRKNTPALSVHRQYIITIGDCQSSCHNCIYRQIFSAAHLAFSADLWYTDYGTQLNKLGSTDTIAAFCISLFRIPKKLCANNRRYFMQGVSPLGARFFCSLQKILSEEGYEMLKMRYRI